jgi:hypothetical protein
MKIQINSLEALERLIGGDNELEIDIRNSVVQDFSKKHLKSVAQTLDGGLFKQIVESSRKAFKEELQKELGLVVTQEQDSKSSYYRIVDVVKLSAPVKAQIKALAEKEAGTVVNELYSNAFREAFSKYKGYIKIEVENAVQCYSNKYLKDDIVAEVEKAMLKKNTTP